MKTKPNKLTEAMQKANVELERNRSKAIHNFVCTIDGVEDHRAYDNTEFLNLVSVISSCLRDSKRDAS